MTSPMSQSGWPMVALGELAEVRAGHGFPHRFQGKAEGLYPFFKVSDMNTLGNETVLTRAANYINESVCRELKAKPMPVDTVVFPKVGAAVATNKKRILGQTSVVDNNVMGVTVADASICRPEFLLRWLQHVDLREFSNPGPLPSIAASAIKAAKLPLPPPTEQLAIAHVLRTVQQAKEATEQVIAAAQELKKSLMRHVFTHGPVSVREVEPVAWPTEALERLVQEDRPIRYGILKPGPDIEHGVSYVKVRDYPNGAVELSSIKRTSIEIANQYRRASLQEGDIIVSIRGTTGRVAVVPRELDGGNITQDTARVSPRDSVDRDYLVQYLCSEEAQKFISSWTRGAAVQGINLRELRQLPIPLPSHAVQRRIGDLLGAVGQKISAEEARRDALNTLFDSLLHNLMTARLRVTDLEVPA